MSPRDVLLHIADRVLTGGLASLTGVDGSDPEAQEGGERAEGEARGTDRANETDEAREGPQSTPGLTSRADPRGDA